MAKEILVVPDGTEFLFLTGEDADDLALEIARGCAANGGVVAAEIVAKIEGERKKA